MSKRPEKMTDAEHNLEIQMSLAKKTRGADIATIIITLAIIFGFAAAIYIVPDAQFSEQENRYLQQFPALSSEGKHFDRFFSGKFTSEIADYYSDQFPARDVFVGMKGVAEIALCKTENNNVVLGSGGYIIKRNGYPDYTTLDKNIKSLTAFASATSELDIPYTVALAGRGEDVLTPYLPTLYPTDICEKLWAYTKGSFSNIAGMSYIDLRAPIAEAVVSGSEQLYYRTDHHWTSAGAFMAYNIIAPSLSIENPLAMSDITVEDVSDAFYGTTWSSAGMKWIAPDSIEYYRYNGDMSYKTHIADTDTEFDGFYDRSYLEKKDKYSSFIGGNNARADVYAVGENGEPIGGRKKLLVIKDSFAHSVAPFLARDYDLVILDLRYYKSSVKQLCADEGIDAVLVLVNIDSLTAANTFGILQMGL
ncbi:MAG: DHHW family protein [Eubacteriales bacterium]